VVRSATLHDLLWRDEPDATTEAGRKFHEGRLLYLYAREDIRLVATSPWLAERLVVDGVARERVYVTRLGVDDGGVAAAPPSTVSSVLAQSGVVGPFTLHVGTREPRKNVARLLAAHRMARREAPELGPLVLAGPPGWGEVDTEDAVVLGLVPREVLLGLYRDATVVAYVPRAEGWGLPPVEALHAGSRVVVAQHCPSVIGNDTVVGVEPLDVDDIAAGLVRGLTLPDDESARAARRASVAELTWRNCALDHVAAWS
jgi:glycosyltransferase involved in cell wall biosynthesis